MYRIIKRALDFLFALILLPLFIMSFIFIGIAIKVEDRGPIFYMARYLKCINLDR